jgi:glycosyltransferase involved in cell wall biosynthesis
VKIVYVWDADYPWDVRAEKICSFLARRGDDVTIAARNRAWHPLTEPRPEGTVRRMAPWRALGRTLDGVLSFPAFFNPRWIVHLDRTVRLAEPDVVIVRDLPLAPTAVWIGRRHGVPVVLDMAENYPAMIAGVWETGRQRWFDGLVRSPANVARVERWTVDRVAGILVVVEESGDRLVGMGVPPERITIVSNTPPRARASAPLSAAQFSARAMVRLVYLGLLEVHRGVGDLLTALALLRDRGHSVETVIVGDGRDETEFHRQAERLGLAPPTVTFAGRLSNDAALQRVAQADVGVVPHLANESWNTTIPNKLFDYMAAGLAVVSSDAIPCRRIVTETASGRVYRAGDPGDLARAITELLPEDVRRVCGRAGRAAILERYNWEHDCARLQAALDAVTVRPPG